MTAQDNIKENILVIKLGALGDFIQALGPMAAIRKHHPNAHVTLLTTQPFKKFAKNCGYFDNIWLDEKPKFYQLSMWHRLRKNLNEENFTRIYDLQNNDRTSFYFRLLKSPQPEWVGVAKGASHRNTSPQRIAGHAFDGHVQTLSLAGIKDVEIDTLEWMSADISAFDLQGPYALLVPGSAPQHPYKRWPAKSYGALAKHLADKNIQPVILGTDSEAEMAQTIKINCPAALNLCGQTSLEQIVTLARGATMAIGNDTGPMHLIAATALPCLTLFSSHSNPVRHKPKGADVQAIQKNNLNDLKISDVLENLKKRNLIS